MKRNSQIKRKTPLASKAPIARKREKRQPVQKAQKAVQKGSRWRSPRYLAWVRTLPCCVCGRPADSAHHLIGIWGMSGMGLKSPDSMVMPVCDGPGGCHAEIHSQAELRNRQPGFLRDTISRGVREFDGEIKQALLEAWAIIDEKRGGA